MRLVAAFVTTLLFLKFNRKKITDIRRGSLITTQPEG